MSSRIYGGPSRYICTVLEEMRTAHKSHNYSYLLGLIDECQVLANRMEAALSEKSDIRDWTKVRAELKKEIRELEAIKESFDVQPT